jgi:hypothetical protein
MKRYFVVAGILFSLLVCADCNSSNDGVAYLKPPMEEGLPQPLTMKQRLGTLTPVFDSFADALEKISSKYPEMAGYSRDKAINQSEDTISCEYSHNFTRPQRMWSSTLPSDFGENGFIIRLSCKAMHPLHQPAYQMPPPALYLDNLQFYGWTLIGTGSNPSPGLLDEVNAIIRSHLDKLTEADRIACNYPNNMQVVLEALDRGAFRAAMPPEKKITLEEYRKLKNKYISRHESCYPDFFIYRIKEGNEWRTYDLILVCFNNKNAWIAEMTQFHIKGEDWVALYSLDRCDEVDKDFAIAKIIEERSKVVGGVHYGMSVADVIQLKGKHYKIGTPPPAEMMTSIIFYDDVTISVRERSPVEARVVRVEPTSNKTKEYMKDIPYQDEK